MKNSGFIMCVCVCVCVGGGSFLAEERCFRWKTRNRGFTTTWRNY